MRIRENIDTPASPDAPLILIVDDTELVRDLYSKMLSKSGYRCLTAKGGAECLELLNLQSPDIVLLDYTMPLMTGEEVLRKLRGAPKTASLPVIVLTASAAPEHHKKALAAGANVCIVKPVPRLVLLENVTKVLELHGQLPEATRLVRPRRTIPPTK